MNVYEMYGRDEVFHKIVHDKDDALLCNAINKVERV